MRDLNSSSDRVTPYLEVRDRVVGIQGFNTVLLIGKVWDAINDPMVGILSEAIALPNVKKDATNA